MIIEENYVSLETAKLLKEKGFDWNCESKRFYPEPDYDQESPNGVSAPTLQMAMRWLREVHHIVLVVDYDYDYEYTDKSYCYKVYCLGENGKPERVPIYGVGYDIEGNQHRVLVSYRNYERSFFEYIKYEEACEAAIKYCLKNLI